MPKKSRKCLPHGATKRGCNQRGCLQTQTNASKRAQTQTNADFRLSEKGPKTQVNARKRAQTQTNADKRKIEEFHPLLRTPFCGSPAPAASGPGTPKSFRRLPRQFPRFCGDFSGFHGRRPQETLWRLFGVPGPEAPGDIFETSSAFRVRRARETSVRGGLVHKRCWFSHDSGPFLFLEGELPPQKLKDRVPSALRRWEGIVQSGKRGHIK